MRTSITVQLRNHYGNEVFYPVCSQAHHAARIAGTKTLTITCLRLLQQMGFTVTLEQKLGNSFISAPLPDAS